MSPEQIWKTNYYFALLVLTTSLVLLVGCANSANEKNTTSRSELRDDVKRDTNSSELDAEPETSSSDRLPLKSGNKEASTDFVSQNLDTVVKKWTNPEVAEYTSKSRLKLLWTRHGRHPWDYFPEGASLLIKEIKGNDFFRECEKEKNVSLKLKWFRDDDEIEKVEDLWKKLSQCNDS